MLTYPILEWWFNFAIALPSFLWGIVIVGLLLLGFFKFGKIRNAILGILGAPIVAYLFCYACKAAQELPLVGPLFIIIRIVIDISIIGGIIMIIRYLTTIK